jgi:hypothetical protein
MNVIVKEIFKKGPLAIDANRLGDSSMKLTNHTNPFYATLSASKLLVEACLPPNIKYPVKCIIFALQLGMCVYYGGTTSILSTTLTLATARQIIEEMT